MSTIQLREYQHDAVEALKRELSNTTSTLLVASVGAGKTIMQAAFIQDMIAEYPDTRFICAVHTRELVGQNVQALLKVWPEAPAGINSAALGRRDTRSQILFCSIQSVYKHAQRIGWTDCLIVDECFSGDTEILTEIGYVRFDQLADTLRVAQFDEKTGLVDFVRPLRRIEKAPDSEVYRLHSKNFGDWFITGGHEMLVQRTNGPGCVKKVKLRDLNFNSKVRFFAAGLGAGSETSLSAEDKFWIAFQADGNLHKVNLDGSCRAYFSFSKQRKIDKFLELVRSTNWSWNEIPSVPGPSSENVKPRRRFSVRVPYTINKDVSSRFHLPSLSAEKARLIIEYMNHWDGHVATKNTWLYTSTDRRASDFYQAVCALAGYYTYQSEAEDERSDKFSKCYRLFINIKNGWCGCQQLRKEVVPFSENVHCVEVPKGNIIVRKNGRTMVTGNCHLISPTGTTMYRQFIEDLRSINPDLRIVGMSGTPFRMDSGSLVEGETALFDSVAYEIGIGQLISEGYLTRPISKGTATTFDVTGVHTRGGEYIAGELERAVNKSEITEAAVREIVAFGQDRKSWLVFCAGIAHAAETRDAIRRQGITCEMVEGSMPAAERRQIIAAYRRGQIRCLTNVNVLSIGFDYPAIDLIALMRPTKSGSLYVQQCGRGLRLSPGKETCLILDFANVVRTLGPLDDVQFKKPGKGTGEAPIRMCPQCDCINHASARVCEDCGFEFPESENPRHSATADVIPILSTDVDREPNWIPVVGRTFAQHDKVGMPPSVKITFETEDGKEYSFWRCCQHGEHPKGARAKAQADRWWNDHGGKRPFPKTVDEFLDRAAAGELKVTAAITIRKDGRYWNPDIEQVGEERDATYVKPPKREGNLVREPYRWPAGTLQDDDTIPF